MNEQYIEVSFSAEDVDEGRRLVVALDGAQWALGDLAVRVAGPASTTRANDGSIARLSVFADAIGIHHEQLGRYRSVATAWPPDRRIEGASWTLHRTLAPLPQGDREALLGEFVVACELGGVRPTRDRLITKLKTMPILPENEPSVLPTLASCLAEQAAIGVAAPPPGVASAPADAPRPKAAALAADVFRINAPEWMPAELTHVRMASERMTVTAAVDLTANEALAQFYELETWVAALNEYRRTLLFSIVAVRPRWWPELEHKLEEMEDAEQFLLKE